MKKFIAIASAALICGTLALSACNGDGGAQGGEIAGNYVEITTAELNEKLNTFSSNKLFGDTSEEKWKFGAEIGETLDITVATRSGAEQNSSPLIDGRANLNGQTQFILTSSQSQTALGGMSLRARSSQKLTGSLKKCELLGLDKDISADYNVNAFADGENLYFTLPDLSDLPLDAPPEGKYRLPLQDIIDKIKSFLPQTEALAEAPDKISAWAEEYKLKAFADETDGLKIKVSADATSLYAVMENFLDMTAEQAKAAAAFDAFAVDLYLETDSEGAFVRAGFTIDIDGSLSLEEGALGEDFPAVYGSVKIKGDVSVKKFAGEVVLPNSEELNEYTDLLEQQTEKQMD